MAQELVDLDVTHVSLVDKGANQRRFAVTKRDATGEPDAIHKAIQAAVAKGRGDKPGLLSAIKKAVVRKRRVRKSAADLVSLATWALSYVMDLIEDEAAGVSEDPLETDAGEDQADITTLRSAAQLLTDYIASTAQEVGTADDVQDVAEEAAAYARAMESYYPIYMRDGGGDIAKGKKQFSTARMERLEAAADTFMAVLAEVKSEETDTEDADASKDTKKRAQPEEDDMTSEELAKALGTALEPITKRLDAIEKAQGPAAAAGTTAPAADDTVAKGDDGDWTLAGIGSAISKLIDRVEKVEHQRGERTSAVGQDTTGTVKKSGGTFAGVLRDA